MKTVARLRTTMALSFKYSTGTISYLFSRVQEQVNSGHLATSEHCASGAQAYKEMALAGLHDLIHINERGAKSTPRQKPSAMETLLTFL